MREQQEDLPLIEHARIALLSASSKLTKMVLSINKGDLTPLLAEFLIGHAAMKYNLQTGCLFQVDLETAEHILSAFSRNLHQHFSKRFLMPTEIQPENLD